MTVDVQGKRIREQELEKKPRRGHPPELPAAPRHVALLGDVQRSEVVGVLVDTCIMQGTVSYRTPISTVI